MESCSAMAPRSSSWRILMLTLFAAALVELTAADAVREDQLQGTAHSSGGGEALLWYLPIAVGAVVLLSVLVILCVSGDGGGRRNYHNTTTEPFLSTAIAAQQAAPDHIYVNQPGNQRNGEGELGPTATSPVHSGQSTPQYATVSTGRGLLQNVYIQSDGLGVEETGSDLAQRGYEVPRASVKDKENAIEAHNKLYVNESVQSTEGKTHAFYRAPNLERADLYNSETDASSPIHSVSPPTSPLPPIPDITVEETDAHTKLYVNESVQSTEGKTHAFYRAPNLDRADLYNSETDASSPIHSVSPPTVPLPPIPDRTAVTTVEKPRSQPPQSESRPSVLHLRRKAPPSLPSFADASMQVTKSCALPSPAHTLSGNSGSGDDLKYKEPPTTERLIQENFRDMKCLIVPSGELRLGEKLGEGHFATVLSAVWNSRHGQFNVAVKKLKSRASTEERIKFLQEAVIMAQFFHPNIVQLCGMTQDTMQGIILELLPNGSLKSYLEACRRHVQVYPEGQIASALLLFAQQIASGMNYLANKEFVHRDLAARNILLDADYVCKIGDFGLARGIAGESYYTAKSGQIPVKWTAPEALEFNRYTSASDVWSYGVLLFEMWSLGRQPMADKKNAEISHHLNGGYRMPPPPGCSRGIYKLMIKCWHPDPKKRPTFGMVYGAIEAKGLELLTMDGSATRSSIVSTSANAIGSSLAAGEGLYRDLQVAYR